MVHLIGVNHRGCLVFCGAIRAEALLARPSQEFMDYLSKFPRGTRVGIESLSEEDWKKVKQDLGELTLENSDILWGEEKSYAPRYSDDSTLYFNDLQNICISLGLNVIFLEDVDAWLKYNQATIKSAIIDARTFEKVLFKREGETGFDYSKKLLVCNEVKNKAVIRARKIHEIERDEKLSEAIARGKIDLAVVGHVHSDLWFADKSEMFRKYGIDFKDYSTDLMFVDSPYMPTRAKMVFTRNADCDPNLVFERESLERAIRLIETGRVVSEPAPDYVGVWEPVVPSEGYFEVFLDSSDEFRGLIQDCVGVASFQGELTEKTASFIKRYSELSLPEVIKGDIEYKGVRKGDEVYGRFFAESGYSNVFYMRKSPQARPLDLAIRLEKLWEQDKESFNQFNPPGWNVA